MGDSTSCRQSADWGTDSHTAIAFLGRESCGCIGVGALDHSLDQGQVEPTGGLAILVAEHVEWTVTKSRLAVLFSRLIPGFYKRLRQAMGAESVSGAPRHLGQSVIAGGFWDVALRDFGLLLGALALGQLAQDHA